MSTREKPPLESPLDQYLTSGLSELQGERVWAKVRAQRAHLAQTTTSSKVALSSPLGPALLDEHGLAKSRAQVWREVRARVRRPKERRNVRLAVGTASLLSAAVVCALLLFRFRGSDRGADRSAAPALVLADGRALRAVESGAAPRTVRFSDASEIRLAAASRVEPLNSSGSRFELLLARGSAEFSVTPGGPRRWLVEAGAARVEVVGTVFRVTRTATAVRVSVSRGSVLVRGEQVPGWVQRLNAGEQLTVSGKERARAASVPTIMASRSEPTVEPVSAPAPARTLRALPEQAATGARETAGNRRRGANGGEQGAAALSPTERYASLGAAGLARATMNATSIDELLELADVARLSGHPQDAVAPLTRALDAFRDSRQAGLAAFTLGRVLLDQLDAAPPAAEAFERALVLGLPRGLRADCYRRLAEAYARSGNTEQSIQAEHRLSEETARSAQEVGRGASP